MKTIYILWLRQLKRYFRSKSRMIGSLAQPLFFLLSLGYGFGPVFKQAGEGNYIQFLVPGIIGMSIIFTSIFSGMEIIWDRQFGFLKETLVAPVSRFNIMIGRTIGGATVATDAVTRLIPPVVGGHAEALHRIVFVDKLVDFLGQRQARSQILDAIGERQIGIEERILIRDGGIGS